MRNAVVVLSLAFGSSLASLASARDLRITVEHGYEFVTVGAPGNRGYEGAGDQWNSGEGFGAVDYKYRIARREVATGDWVEFLNATSHLSSNPNFWINIGPWQATGTAVPGQYILNNIPDAALVPAGGVNFLEAAMYCNWLHNDKAVSVEALSTGAYDLAAVGLTINSGDVNGRALPREPGARFFVPTRNEWVKAVHFDPDAEDEDFPGQGRYWLYPNGTDEPLTPGYPGEKGAETSAGLGDHPRPPGSPLAANIPVGSYPDSQTPWGLLDASGGMSELLDAWTGVASIYRNDGTAWNSLFDVTADLIYASGNTMAGLRLAAAIPSPSILALLSLSGLYCARRRRGA